MANLYLDTNILVDLIGRGTRKLEEFEMHTPFYSTFSVLVLCYLYKNKMPFRRLEMYLSDLNPIDLTDEILDLAIQGPTDDIEDNAQLHSAAHSNCDYFVTDDKKLLQMKFFGKVKIINSLSQ